MPVLFVHGVAVRNEDDPQFSVVERLTRGAEWPVVEELLRTHVAPELNRADPDAVDIARVYWGDLGARPADDPALEADAEQARSGPVVTPEDLGEELQRALTARLPRALWPAAVRAVWSVVGLPSVHDELADTLARHEGTLTDGKPEWLDALIEERLVREAPELAGGLGPIAADILAQGQRGVRRWMVGIRRPIEAVTPFFVGDVLTYMSVRGLPGSPGPVLERTLEGLDRSAEIAAATGEPLVVLTHSMGGQIMYDALTAFGDTVAGGDLHVDLWCAAGGQLGVFADVGVLLDPGEHQVPLGGRVGYLWNAWSASDVLSFPAEGRVPAAHDTDFGFSGTPAANHMAYLREPDFYRTLAAMVAAHALRR